MKKYIFFLPIIILIFMFNAGKTYASCSTSVSESFSTSGSIATMNPAYSVEYGCSYHVDIVRVDFKTDTVGSYALQYSLDQGLTWHSQFQGATNSAQLVATNTTDTYSLSTWSDPSLQVGVKDTFGNWNINNNKLALRLTSTDATGFVLSSTEFTPETILDDSAVPADDSTTSLSASNPIKVCDPLDVPCNIVNGITNLITFLFKPPNNFASGTFSLVKSSFDSKVPFAYINTALATDFSNTATSTAIPDFVIPFPTGTVLGQSLSIPTQTIHFPDQVHDALGTIRPYLNFGLYATLVLYFITLAQRIF